MSREPGTPQALLPSWRPGATRDALVDFLEASAELAPDSRLACFDNDGTLWAERPTYAQFDFFVDALARRAAADPGLASRLEYAALLAGDRATVGDLGLARVAMALLELFDGQAPEAFAAEVRDFLSRARHVTLDRPLRSTVYVPMLELLDALDDRGFTVAIVTGGGTEFVRAVSSDLYGVLPERVVGTLITYAFSRDERGRPSLRRSAQVDGRPNEGEVKVSNIQTQLGRAPALAAGNSAGDREMLEWALSTDRPSLALLIDHDDEDREFRYDSAAETVQETEPIRDVAARLGWTIASMRRD
ncbi:phosphoserine phosphatase [Humibacillus xanthopallidus]|uniref:Phosphoserine phosphatase n=1 Tax=Humibacillus xanthopallidus TaxID=412689 RepID=A0A543PR71_9MICO|nr:HAD family hydrolase [Humibacillus xanthopallidus]TQN46569.1 phosphoserine phosphatase [Humibacillus xanthopallidus]